MYRYDEIKTIHLEITDKCNAACPMCARNINGGEENPQLPGTELSLDDVKKIFTPGFIAQLDRMYMCGNYGDPIVARDTLEVFEYFRNNNAKINLSMHTNGSAKKLEWWARLAEVLRPKGHVIFGIDGLEDTNHLYRQNTVWNRIMSNAHAFIAAGGRARWDYIVFAHNEHQVEQAERLSEKMGFEKFQIKKSARFFSNSSGVTKEMHQAANKKGLETTLLQVPKNPKYRNAALDRLGEIAKTDSIKFIPSQQQDLAGQTFAQTFCADPEKKKPMERVWDEAVIKCKVKEEKSLYITAEGIVQPCCWTAGQMYVWYWTPKGGQIWNLIDQVGKENLSALTGDLESIVNGKFMQELVPQSWKKSSCHEGKLAVCAKTCGGKYDAFAEQFK